MEVRSKEEILRTLDENGRLDGMPFMPEMLEFCGKRFQVFKRPTRAATPTFSPGDSIPPSIWKRVATAAHMAGAKQGACCSGRRHG